jgi:hypothetical protein
MEASPYLTLHEAAAYLRYQTVAGFRQAVRRLRIPHLVRGRERLFLPSDLQRVWTRPQRSRKPRTDEAV